MFWFKRNPSSKQITDRAQQIRTRWTDNEQQRRQLLGVARQDWLFRVILNPSLSQQSPSLSRG